ncbi:hypothetical protein [Sulfurimonas sp.]|uniref:hypothetical protein n=1 Tax=Sulfurimonas sp. TaxID=2022749 RepID=UPI0025E27CC8|nr:hypothetical protein [Sulfurimonas sp.]
MKKIIYSLVIFAFAIGFSGCSGSIKNMTASAPNKLIEAPASGKSKIVFMRPSTLGYAIQSSVFKVDNNVTSIVGIVAAKKKVSYELDPGKHLFMVIGKSADFMSANLEADKIYYALVTPRLGFWKARFSLAPVHLKQLSSEKFTTWLKECQLVEVNSDTQQWSIDNAESIQSKYNEYYKDWMNKEAYKRPLLTENDGLKSLE